MIIRNQFIVYTQQLDKLPMFFANGQKMSGIKNNKNEMRLTRESSQ